MRAKRILITLLIGFGIWLLMHYCLRLFWSEPFLNLKYDWGYALFDWLNSWQGSLNSWNDWFLGGSIVVNSGWLVAVILVIFSNLTHLAITPVMAMLLTAILVAAAVGMAVLLRARGVRWWIAIALGVLYALAPMMWIRIVIGFVNYLLAAALAPWFVWLWERAVLAKKIQAEWLVALILAALISSQPQFVMMVGLLLTLDLIFAPKAYRQRGFKLAIATVAMLGVTHAPWLVLLFHDGVSAVSETSSLAGSLSTIQAIPHSALRTLFGADHHITYQVIDQLMTNRGYAAASIGLVGLALLSVVIVRRQRVVKGLIVALAIGWLMGLGPQVPTGQVFIWIYQHLPFNNIFREVYHWSWLITFALISLAGLSLEVIARYVRAVPALLITSLMVVFWVGPWLRGDFYSYITPLTLPAGYQSIAIPASEALNITNRSLFLPSMGFMVFRDDKTPGAVNSDIYSFSTNRSQPPFTTSLLDFPTRAQELRNATVMALRTSTAGNFKGYLDAMAVDTIFDRPTLKTKFTELFTLPKSRLEQVKDWQDLRYAPLLAKAAEITKTQVYDGVTEYQVNRPTSLISYAQEALLVGDDWRKLAANGAAAVYFASDAFDQLDLPYQGEVDDYLAAQLQDANITPYADGGSVLPADGWSSKGAVWWWDPALSTIKGSYLFTTSKQALTKTITLDQASYTVMVKYWASRWAKELIISIGGQPFTIPTTTTVDGEWRWQKLGPISGNRSDVTISITGSGETGIAQLLVVPNERLRSIRQPNLSGSEPVAVPDLKFTKQSPSRYLIELNNRQAATIIARIGYDLGWRLHTSAGDLKPALVNGYAMAFNVPPLQETATLEFMPQRTYITLIYLAAAVIVATIIGAGWLALSSRRKTKA